MNSTENNLIPNEIGDASISYFLGYVVHKINNKIKCEECIKSFSKEKIVSEILPREHFIEEKTYAGVINGLNFPTNELFEVCKLHIEYFKKNFSENLHIENIKQFYLIKCISITNEIYPQWFSNSSCREHRIKILDFLLLVLLRKNCSWMCASLNKFPEKLKVLKK